jgi:hypothetical protein
VQTVARAQIKAREFSLALRHDWEGRGKILVWVVASRDRL